MKENNLDYIATCDNISTIRKEACMINGKEELLRALTDVYIMEKETNDFYSMASGRANEGDAKEAFRELACRKQVHMKYVRFLYRTIQGNGEIVSFEDFKRRTDIQLEGGRAPVNEQEIHYSYTDDTGLLINALEIESRTHELYRKLSETAPDSSAKAVFKEMMMQEDNHIDYLKRMPGAQIEE